MMPNEGKKSAFGGMAATVEGLREDYLADAFCLWDCDNGGWHNAFALVLRFEHEGMTA